MIILGMLNINTKIIMNYCPSCGTKTDIGWNICPNCSFTLQNNNVSLYEEKVSIYSYFKPPVYKLSSQNTYGIISLVFGILGSILFLFGIVLFVFFSILAIIFGGIGIGKDNSLTKATGGIALGIIDLLLFIIFPWTFFMWFFF